MRNLRNWKWWAGLTAGSLILWAVANLMGVTDHTSFFIIGGGWGLIWSLSVWPKITEGKNNATGR